MGNGVHDHWVPKFMSWASLEGLQPFVSFQVSFCGLDGMCILCGHGVYLFECTFEFFSRYFQFNS